MPVVLQAKLLRFLQDQVVERVGGRTPIKVDVRIVSATNQPLEEQAEQGRFRGDLLYRLNSVTLRIPPLRQRPGDQLLLARYFLGRYTREFGVSCAASIPPRLIPSRRTDGPATYANWKIASAAPC